MRVFLNMRGETYGSVVRLGTNKELSNIVRFIVFARAIGKTTCGFSLELYSNSFVIIS